MYMELLILNEPKKKKIDLDLILEVLGRIKEGNFGIWIWSNVSLDSYAGVDCRNIPMTSRIVEELDPPI